MTDDIRNDAAAASADITEAPTGETPVGASPDDITFTPNADLPPLLPSAPAPASKSKSRKKGKGRPRIYSSPEAAAAARKKRDRERRQREKAQRAAEAVAGIQHNERPGADVPVNDPPAPPLNTVEQQQDAERDRIAREASEKQLAAMIGLGADLAARYVPTEYGGGALTADEREILGGVWATALLPYLDGPTSAFAVAAVTTVQVFAVRAIAAQHRVSEPSEPSRQGPPVSRPEDTPKDASAPEAPPAAPARKEPKEPEKAAPARRRVKLPQFTGED